MTIILDDQTLPAKGHVELNIAFDIGVTAEEAQRKAQLWLTEEVSSQMGVDTPVLIVGRRTVWRVPAHISFPHTGRFSDAYYVEVDAATGELLNPADTRKAILEILERDVKPRVPPYTPRESKPEHIASHLPPAPQPKFITFDDPKP